MAVAHPTAGSFGVYAEIYLHPWAGFTVRYTYWAAQCIAIGGEATAIAIYCQWWFPDIPKWLWILGFACALLYINARSVGSFGSFEYWFAMIKVVAIVLFIVFGAALLAGIGRREAMGFSNITAHGGFLATGWRGVWMAMVFVIFSYLGTEVVAVTAGEAKDPATAVPRAMRTMVGRLILFYLGAIVVLMSIVPWNQIQPGPDVTASPFVKVFQLIGVPAAAHLVNFVVITAAASSMNCNLYLVSRMMFSLARGGYAPAAFGRVSARGTPVPALMVSAAGLALAIVVALLFPSSAFVYLFGISLFGGLYAWLIIFATHLRFRPKWDAAGHPPLPVRMYGHPFGSLAGTAAIAAIMATTWWVEGMRVTLIAGLPWLGGLTVAYFGVMRKRPAPV
jgi:L-asparagine transporter-like permease